MSEQTHNPTPDQRRNMTGELLSQAEAAEVTDRVAQVLDAAHAGLLAKRERGEPGWQYRSPAAINDAVQDAALRWAMEGRRVPAPEPDVITSAAGPISYAPSADRPCAKCGDDVAGPRHWAGQWVCGGCYARMPAPFTPKRVEEPARPVIALASAGIHVCRQCGYAGDGWWSVRDPANALCRTCAGLSVNGKPLELATGTPFMAKRIEEPRQWRVWYPVEGTGPTVLCWNTGQVVDIVAEHLMRAGRRCPINVDEVSFKNLPGGGWWVGSTDGRVPLREPIESDLLQAPHALRDAVASVLFPGTPATRLATGTLAPLERGHLRLSERNAGRTAVLHDEFEDVRIAVDDPDAADAIGDWYKAWAARMRGR